MLHQTFLFLGQLWQLFEVSQILEFLRKRANNVDPDEGAHYEELYQNSTISISGTFRRITCILTQKE